MAEAIRLGASVRRVTSPNPWVGCVIVSGGDVVGRGATAPPGGPHAEVVALAEAKERARGATCYVSLEPCAHEGRTGPCVDALLAAGVQRVVAPFADPDDKVAGVGFSRLEAAGVEVVVGPGAHEAFELLEPYFAHRQHHRPFVVLKMAMTLDGRIAAPDGSSRYLTGPEALHDVHELRADSDAILVGAGTTRADDPSLTARLAVPRRDPLRVVLGSLPPGAAMAPALELSASLEEVLDELYRRGVIQLLVEGGSHVAHDFHEKGLVDRYVFYLTPSLFGGDDALPVFSGPGAPTLGDRFSGEIVRIERLGADLRVDLRRLVARGGKQNS